MIARGEPNDGASDDGNASGCSRRPVVGVVGDGRLDEDSLKWVLARNLGEALVDGGYRVACGGLSGVMEAVCRGAHRAEAYSDGDTIGMVPGSDREAANRWVDVVIPTGLGHFRNGLVAQSAGIVAIGGGAGTLSEMAFAWIHDRMIVAMDVDGWSGELAGGRIDGRQRLPDFDDDRVFRADTPDRAVEWLDRYLDRYLSS